MRRGELAGLRLADADLETDRVPVRQPRVVVANLPQLSEPKTARVVEQHARRAGLPMIRLHDLRHSYASAALAAGVPAKVISERLGHATIAVTMVIYSHVLPGLDRAAADAVARLILGGGGVSEASVNKP